MILKNKSGFSNRCDHSGYLCPPPLYPVLGSDTGKCCLPGPPAPARCVTFLNDLWQFVSPKRWAHFIGCVKRHHIALL